MKYRIVDGGSCGRYKLQWREISLSAWDVLKRDKATGKIVDSLHLRYDAPYEPTSEDKARALEMLCGRPAKQRPKFQRRRSVGRRAPKRYRGTKSYGARKTVQQALKRAVAARVSGDVISIPALRRSVPGVSKADFDKAVLDMIEANEVNVHMHDLPASLPKEKRDELVRHPDGTHFVGITPRRKAGTLPEDF